MISQLFLTFGSDQLVLGLMLYHYCKTATYNVLHEPIQIFIKDADVGQLGRCDRREVARGLELWVSDQR